MAESQGVSELTTAYGEFFERARRPLLLSRQQVMEEAGQLATRTLVAAALGQQLPPEGYLHTMQVQVDLDRPPKKPSVLAVALGALSVRPKATVSPYALSPVEPKPMPSPEEAIDMDSLGRQIISAQQIPAVGVPDTIDSCYPVLVVDNRTLAWPGGSFHFGPQHTIRKLAWFNARLLYRDSPGIEPAALIEGWTGSKLTANAQHQIRHPEYPASLVADPHAIFIDCRA